MTTASTTIARILAIHYHEGQTYEGGSYVENHLDVVAGRFDVPAYRTVAYLHDIIEDTTCSADMLMEFFDDDVVRSVLTLTHFDGESYDSYITRVVESDDPVAIAVKIADLEANIAHAYTPTQRARVRTRYLGSLARLLQAQVGNIA